MTEPERSTASFRDPAGFVFERDGGLFRQVNLRYRPHYDHLAESGLLNELTNSGLLIPTSEVNDDAVGSGEAYKVLRAERVPFISYPYEWCFSQLKDAALLTLDVQERALAAGMTLKDASAYNVQFRGGRAVFIDTLSFEIYRAGEPWVAYRQFCQHFLAPLAMMSLADVRLGQLSRANIDGIPLDLAARTLPWRSRLRGGLLLHLHLHAMFQERHGNAAPAAPRKKFTLASMKGLIDSLRATIRKLKWEPSDSGWAGYVRDNTYSDGARDQKHRVVGEFLARIGPGVAWDMGSNTGEYSRLAAGRGMTTIAFDLDPACVERNYREVIRRGETHLLPLIADLTNPSPPSGWRGRERLSMRERGPADVVLALALVHHLAIANNTPLGEIADFFHETGRWLVIEFVPKDDPQARRLLQGREDVFDAYSRQGFEEAFQKRFGIHRCEPLPDCGRVLYLMERKDR